MNQKVDNKSNALFIYPAMDSRASGIYGGAADSFLRDELF